MTLNGLDIFLNLMKALSISYNKENDEGYFLEFDIHYPENNLHNHLSLLPKRMKIENSKSL